MTNWHNVTGLNPENNQYIGSFSPNFLEIYFKYEVEKTKSGANIGSRLQGFSLYKDEKPVWIEHPSRHLIDCVAIPITLPDGYEFAGVALNQLELTHTYSPSVGDDCFIIGYPRGLMAPGMTPIWKRGSIASEPVLNFGGKPLVLVDTATRPGMSGSPVIARHHGLHMPNGEMSGDTVVGTVQNVLGIYSGRTDDDELGVQIGRVWKINAVEEILSKGQLGLHPMDVAYPPT